MTIGGERDDPGSEPKAMEDLNMAAFETNLVAISWQASRYEVVAQTFAQVDTTAMAHDGLLHDVSNDVGYQDEVAVIQKDQFVKYLLSQSNPWNESARKWIAALPKEAMFILVHRAQWESGLSG